MVTLDNLQNPFLNTNPELFTEMHDMESYANDHSLNGQFDLEKGGVTAKLGYYCSGQNIKMVTPGGVWLTLD